MEHMQLQRMTVRQSRVEKIAGQMCIRDRNEALQKKIGLPFCTATTRRVLKLPPSRVRST